MEKEVIDTIVELLEKNAGVFEVLTRMTLMPFTKDQILIFIALRDANNKCIEVLNHINKKP